MPTSAVRIIEYFDGRKQNMIPLFQRPYKWSKDNWDRLWQDILESSPADSPHFMGAIVSTPVTTVPIGVSKHLIIDGQQRLTTIAIILCALRPVLDEKTRDRVQETLLVNSHDEGDDSYLKLFPTNADKLAYAALVMGKPKAQDDSQIHLAFDYFTEKIAAACGEDEGFTPTDILSKIENALRVVPINLDEKTDDPYEIFESLNGTGTPLMPSDLVRNFVLMKFRHSIAPGGEQEQVYEDLWRPLEIECGDQLTQFLLHYCRIDGTEVKRQKVYKAFKEKRKNLGSEEMRSELETIKAYGDFYPRLLDPSRELDLKIRGTLDVLALLKVTVCYPIVLRLYKGRADGILSDAEMKESLRILESYLIRRAVCNVKNNALDGVFSRILQGWPQVGAAGWIGKSLSEGIRNLRWPKDEEFARCFINDGQYGRNATVHVLWSINEFFGHKEAVEDEGITIEHILPQTLDEGWKEYLGADVVEAEHWLDAFGNLTLTGYNPELGNLPFEDKKAIYANSHFSITHQLASLGKWNIEAIKGRGREMAEVASSIWKGPPPSGGE